MTAEPDDELMQRRYMVVVISLLVDADGRLLKGDLAGATAGPRLPFHDWPMLIGQLRQLLEQPQPEQGEGA